MKKPVLFLIAVCLSIAASAQKVYYMYFQSENQSPFYVKISDKTYSSASSGYLIISNLSDSTYNLTVGFPSSVLPELKYTVAINGNDKGLILKNSDAGPSLFDLQTQSVVKPDTEATKNTVAYEMKTDRFSTTLSKAAEDPNLLKVPIQVKQEIAKKNDDQKDVTVIKPDEKQPDQNLAKTDSTNSQSITPIDSTQSDNAQKPDVVKQTKKKKKEKKAQDDAIKTDDNNKTQDQKTTETTDSALKDLSKPVTDSSLSPGEFRRSAVSRHSETSTTEGFGLVYFDIINGTVDTIRLLIPNPKVALKHANDDEMTVTQIPDEGKQDVAQQDNTSKKKTKKKTKEETEPIQTADDQIKVTENPVEVKQDSVQQDVPKKKVSKRKLKEEASKQDSPKDETKLDEQKHDVANQDVIKPDVTTIKSTDVPGNSTCSSVAEDKDFFKLRKLMAGRTSDEAMVEDARKYFKKECFSTEQIRYLSSLFLTSAGKYIFFDAAFSHVSDQENYKSLQSEIKDEYYLKRFKALVGE